MKAVMAAQGATSAEKNIGMTTISSSMSLFKIFSTNVVAYQLGGMSREDGLERQDV